MKKRSLVWISIAFQAIYVIPAIVSLIQSSQMNLSKNNATAPAFFGNIVFNIINLIVFYLFYLVLSPRFLYRQQIRSFFLYAIATLLTAIGLGIVFVWLFTRNIPWFTFKLYYGYFLALYDGLHLFGIAIIACVMRGFFNWIIERRHRQQLEKKNVQTQLALLKAQINPHFLFNTLNNIDVLIEKDPQKASTYLQKLSGILRFMLYENTDEQIALSKEIAYITEYIELQKIRTANPDFINFNVQGDTSHAMIAPMLFIPL